MRGFFSIPGFLAHFNDFRISPRIRQPSKKFLYSKQKGVRGSARQKIFWRAVHPHEAKFRFLGQKWPKSAIIEYVRGVDNHPRIQNAILDSKSSE